MTPFRFVRYVDGQEMAEGVTIEQETTLDAAIKRAVSLCPQRRNTVLVYVPPKREWVGLTDDEIDLAQIGLMREHRHGNATFARAIEKILREKNK